MFYTNIGEFFNRKQYDPCTHCKQPAIPNVVHNKMLQLMVSDYMLNTLGDVYHKLGRLKVVVTDEMIPSWSPVRLNTSSFKCKYILQHSFTTIK